MMGAAGGQGIEPWNQLPVWLKVIVFFVAWVVLWLPIAVPLAIVLRWQPAKPLSPQQKIPLLLSLYLLAPILLWGISWLGGQPFSAYGLTITWPVLRSLLGGVGISLAGLGVLFGLETSAGWIQWRPGWRLALRQAIAPILALAFLVSLIEELVFRGFLQNQLQLIADPWLAAVIGSVIFALLHLVWEGVAIVPQLLGLWLLGLVLVLARWVDGGSLGLAIGLHTGWVWGIASLDAAQCFSPGDPTHLDGAFTPPAWLTGIRGSPLAGLLGIGLLLATGGGLWVFKQYLVQRQL